MNYYIEASGLPLVHASAQTISSQEQEQLQQQQNFPSVARLETAPPQTTTTTTATSADVASQNATPVIDAEVADACSTTTTTIEPADARSVSSTSSRSTASTAQPAQSGWSDFITHRVWLGSWQDALDVSALKRNNVKAVLSVGSRFDLVYSKENLIDNITHVVILAQDEPETNLLSVMHDAADFIESQNRLFAATDKALLVHWFVLAVWFFSPSRFVDRRPDRIFIARCAVEN
jgi:hypothetical protein